MKKGTCLIDGWDSTQISEIVKKQKQLTKDAKKRGDRFMPSCLIVCDDCSDDKKSMHSQSLESLCTRGRHLGISIWILSQRYRLLSQTCRVNASALIVFRLRNLKDLEAILEETVRSQARNH